MRRGCRRNGADELDGREGRERGEAAAEEGRWKRRNAADSELRLAEFGRGWPDFGQPHPPKTSGPSTITAPGLPDTPKASAKPRGVLPAKTLIRRFFKDRCCKESGRFARMRRRPCAARRHAYLYERSQMYMHKCVVPPTPPVAMRCSERTRTARRDNNNFGACDAMSFRDQPCAASQMCAQLRGGPATRGIGATLSGGFQRHLYKHTRSYTLVHKHVHTQMHVRVYT